jgi:transcriptional regulator with XRE-family HTH domain
MNKEIKLLARQKIGEHLAAIRKEKQISTYALREQFGIRFEVIQAIEEGSKNYTIDNFLAYISALDCYFYLANKEGKHLDQADLVTKSKG